MRAQPGKTYEADYLSYDVSQADFDNLPGQFEDAVSFLKQNETDVRALSGGGEAVLDFGYSPRNVAIQVDRLPQELVRLAASLNVEIELSLYLFEPEEEEGDSSESDAA